MADTRAARTIREWLDADTKEDPHTQAVLATRLSALMGRNVNQSTVSAAAHKGRLPRADMVGAFRAVLGIEPEWWLPDAKALSESGTALPSDRPSKTGTGG